MTNARQIKPIYRDLIQRHPGLRVTSNRFLCRTPVHHFAAGVFIERCSDSDVALPMCSISPLFLAKINECIAIGEYAEDLIRAKGTARQDWLWSDPTMVAELIEVIEAIALPRLAFLGRPEGYATLPPRDRGVRWEPRENRMLIHIAVGDLDAARAIWHEREPMHRGKTYHPDSLPHRWQTQLAAVAEPLHAGDRPALARILHGWEAANVRGTEIERYWEPTPFPLEL